LRSSSIVPQPPEGDDDEEDVDDDDVTGGDENDESDDPDERGQIGRDNTTNPGKFLGYDIRSTVRSLLLLAAARSAEMIK
jgi:hypothetical protein